MIVVIDYGVGNVKSVTNAVLHIGCDTKVSCDSKDIEAADGIILPGVGAFGYAMERLGGLAEVISKVVANGKPILGICLGFQLFFDESYELGRHKGLSLVAGKVIPIPPERTVPHMGWNQVTWPEDMTLFDGIGNNKHFAFAHSYYADVSDKTAKVAYTEYGTQLATAVQKENVFGCQFHPEKSSEDGLTILRNFEKICKAGQS